MKAKTIVQLLLAAPIAAGLCVPLAAGARESSPPPVAIPDPQGFSQTRLQRIDAVLQQLIDERQVAGVVARVLKDGALVHQTALGWADVESGRRMQPDTLFRIASQTKALTSAAVLMLMEDGLLELEDPAGDYIDSFAQTTVAVRGEGGSLSTVPAERPITLRDLLTHTAGISYGREDLIAERYAAQQLGPAAGNGWYFADKSGGMCPWMERLGDLPFVAQPGAAFVYGYSTDVLGCIVERVSGLSLDAFLRERITGPLGMRDTMFFVPEDRRERLATLYGSGEDGRFSRAAEGPSGQGHYVGGPGDTFSGGAGLVSTAADYARFLEMIRNGGELDGVRILSPRAVALMRTNQVGDLHLDGLGFGYGFQVVEDYGASGMQAPGAFGWGGAYGSSYRVDPSVGLTMVLMIQLMPNRTDVRQTFENLVYAAME